jgi:hypothetical protein
VTEPKTDNRTAVRPATVRSTAVRSGNPNAPVAREQLGPAESATIRVQLIREIETLQQDDDLQSRSIAILKAKNRLSAVDANLVEEAFSVRLSMQASLSDTSAIDELLADPIDSTSAKLPLIPTKTVKSVRRRGRPRKTKGTVEEEAPLATPSAIPTNDQPLAPPVIHVEADASSAKTQKSELTFSEPRRHRDKGHLKFVSSQPCLVCGRSPADAHHLRFTQPRAMGRKVSDEFTVPLCRTHHRDNHRFGDEAAWWNRATINPLEVARKLWTTTRAIDG